jgi:hypothetical protein
MILRRDYFIFLDELSEDWKLNERLSRRKPVRLTYCYTFIYRASRSSGIALTTIRETV